MNTHTEDNDPIMVVSIGGNSLIKDTSKTTLPDQFAAVRETSRHIVGMLDDGYRIVITHGNGPQVGFILLRSELSSKILHRVPLDVCVADTQGAIGYQLVETLHNELLGHPDRNSAAIVTQVIVDVNDPAMIKPTKPVGKFYSKEEADKLRAESDWVIVEDSGRGWRRVVASPEPKQIVELPAIQSLLKDNFVVVCCGGGGIPIVKKDNGDYFGVSAVIDKDKTSCLLAKDLGAHTLMISTGVEHVCLNFGTPEEKTLRTITLEEAKQYQGEGHFAAGSMGPKIEAAIDFLEHGGKRVIITLPECLRAALKGETGTTIVL